MFVSPPTPNNILSFAWWYPNSIHVFLPSEIFNFCLWLQNLEALFVEWVEDF
jgi:hypothetical protein